MEQNDNRDNREAMRKLAERYAQELDSQVNTLSFFTGQAPEKGRVHEHFLRSVLRRFLPPSLELGTGFASTSVSTSSQCDILVYDRETPLLFQAGDVVVVDMESLHGVVEVKTTLRDLSDLDSLLRLKQDHRTRPEGDLNRGSRAVFTALYGVGLGGMTLSTFTEHFHKWVRSVRAKNLPSSGPIETSGHPDVVYVRERFMLLRAMNDGAYHVLPMEGEGSRSEGDALLGLAAWFYRSYRCSDHFHPWWIRGWDDYVKLEEFEMVKWEQA